MPATAPPTTPCPHPRERHHRDAGILWCLACGSALDAEPYAFAMLGRALGVQLPVTVKRAQLLGNPTSGNLIALK